MSIGENFNHVKSIYGQRKAIFLQCLCISENFSPIRSNLPHFDLINFSAKKRRRQFYKLFNEVLKKVEFLSSSGATF